MRHKQAERLLGIYLAVGACVVTLAVAINTVTDPVNVPKLFVLGVMGFGVLFILISNGIKARINESPLLYLAIISFLAFGIMSTFFSNSPMSQNLYGVYGRNSGLLTYLLLSFVLLAASQLRSSRSFNLVVISFFVAGFGNLFYCTWAIFFGDFIPWNNPYGNILGTLGNPNFIGSFMGMFCGALFAQLFNSNLSKNKKLFLLASLPFLFFVTYKSHAIQGRVLAASGFVIVLFFVIREKYSNRVLIVYSIGSILIGAFALLGALQKGPLADLIYKTSVSLRGQYWAGGMNAGRSHLWTGVGFDAFGDWYRRMREPRALVLPGPNTVVNASHNVPIDIFAFGGIPLITTYILIIALVLVSSFRFIKQSRKFDSIFVTLFTLWVAYQLQSIISINQIGLAVWGWLLSGCLIAYSQISLSQEPEKLKITSKPKDATKVSNYLSPGLLGGVGILVGALVSVPPLSADMKWRNAQISGDVTKILASLQPGYLNPQNTNRYLNIAIALESSKFNEEALSVTKLALDFNPDSFETWRLAYYLKSADDVLKNQALSNMRRLDPLNLEVTSTQ